MASGSWFKQQNLRRSIPGVSGKKIPGNPKMPSMTGDFKTNIGFQTGNRVTLGSSLYRERHRMVIRDSRGRFAGGWGYAWQGLALSASNLQEFSMGLEKNIQAAADKLAKDMLSYAQANAPWQDHPGIHEDARLNLQAKVVKSKDDGSFTIYLGHGRNVFYGIWLEVRWAGKYAILLPTLYKFAPSMTSQIKVPT